MRSRPAIIVLALLATQALASCRAMEGSPCSAPNVVDTVRSLEGENSDNPGVAVLMTATNATFSLDAIRTVSSSSSASVCEGRLTVEFHMVSRNGKLATGMPISDPNRPPGTTPPETAQARAAREAMEKQMGTRVFEVTYKVERTDKGEDFVTIIPSDADIQAQQQQQVRQQQFEQNLRDDQERDRQYQEQLQQQRDQEWRERQEQELQQRN